MKAVKNFKKVLDISAIDAHLQKLCGHLAAGTVSAAGTPVLDIVLLEGARYFYDRLSSAGTLGAERLDMKVKSYEGTQSTGTLAGLALDRDIGKFKKIRVFDDICDTGFTLEKMREFLQNKISAGTVLEFYTLFNKPGKNKFPLSFPPIDIPPLFVIGCGLDYNGKYRELDGLFEWDAGTEKQLPRSRN